MTDTGRDDAPAEGGDGAADLIGGGFGSPVADRVYDLLAPVVATTGAELVDVHWAGGILRLAVESIPGGAVTGDEATTDDDADSATEPGDRPAGDGSPPRDGITTDALAEINRLVSPLLDQHDPVPGRYTLEVSSPGVERPLRRHEHFARAVGETVIVKTVPGHETRRFRGVLRAIESDRLQLAVDEIDGVALDESTDVDLDLADVASARTHFDWGPTPKKGGKGAGNKNKTGKNSNKKKKKGGNGQRAATTATTTEEERGRT